MNVPTSCGEDILRVDTTGDEATKPSDIVLTEEQSKVLEKVKNGDNVFFTGSAGSYSHPIALRYILSTRFSGTGKTVLLCEILRFLGSTGRRVAVTASTGIASISIGGTTLHSWAGIGLGEGTSERLSGKILGTERLRKRWRDVDGLIIDESKISFLRVGLMPNKRLVSMISGGLFDKLVSLHVIFWHMMLMSTRRRSHKRLDLVRTRLGGFRSDPSHLVMAHLTIFDASSFSPGTSASCHQFRIVTAE